MTPIEFPEQTLTFEQFRDFIKDAYFEGFKAARRGTDADAWELSEIRKDIDYHGLFSRIEKPKGRRE